MKTKFLITKQSKDFLQKKEFINIGTCDYQGRPNVAPKFLLKIRSDDIYLVDYVMGRTYANIRINPRVSLSTVDTETLTGYQINGSATLLSSGPEYAKGMQLLEKKQIDFSTKRIIDGVRKQKTHPHFEVTFPEEVVIIKVHTDEVVEIGPSGKIMRKEAS